MQIQRQNSRQDKFLRTLAESMHQMAQPLSTIQASLELAVLSPTTADEYKEIAENVLAQLRSAVDTMQFAARLSRFQRPATDVRNVSLNTALQEVISGLQRTLDTVEVKLLIRGLEHEPLISASPTRLRQMLFYVLQAVQHYSQPGDLAKIETDGTAGHLRLRIQHVAARTGQFVRPLSPQDEITDRALALADAIVTSDGGTFSVSTSPLLIVADFPLNYESRAAAMDKHKASGSASSPVVIASDRLSKMS
jgi:signal transduction histidine kinase